MRLKSTYRTARRNDWFSFDSSRKQSANRRQLNKDFKRVDGSSWTKDFSIEIKPIGSHFYVKGKNYPYGSHRQGYDVPEIIGPIVEA